MRRNIPESSSRVFIGNRVARYNRVGAPNARAVTAEALLVSDPSGRTGYADAVCYTAPLDTVARAPDKMRPTQLPERVPPGY